MIDLLNARGHGMIDTLKTTGAGMGGWWLSISGWLPEIVSLSVGIATLVYLIIKIKKEANGWWE